MSLLFMRSSRLSVHNPTSRLANDRVQWVSSPVFYRYYQEAKTAFVLLLGSFSLAGQYLGWLPRIADGKVLGLIEAFLKQGVLGEGIISDPLTGSPQGGVMTPHTQKVTSAFAG